MDAIDVSRNAAEDLSEGINALVEIAVHADDSNSAAISRMRDALKLMQEGVLIRADRTVDDELIGGIDTIIKILASPEDLDVPNLQKLARAYLTEIEKRWLKKP